MTNLPDAPLEQSFLEIAISRSVVIRALRIAIVVGLILAVINHGDMIVRGEFSLELLCKIFLTFLVPYSVSTYSSVLAVREKRSN